MMDAVEAPTDIIINPIENNVGENNGAMIPAVNHATAKFVKNSEKILPIN